MSKNSKIDKKSIEELRKKITDRDDPITWRRMIIEIKKLFGLKDPEFGSISKNQFTKAEQVVTKLTKDTSLEDLQTEILYSLGFDDVDTERSLDALIINAVHGIEPIFLTLYENMKKENKKVAAFDPVGHYNDMQTRIVGPAKLFGRVKRLIIIASTQEMYGGSIAVLANVLRILRNKDITSNVQKVEVVVPMFGGSRGHREGQADEVGYEVLESIFNAKLLSLTTKDIIEQLKSNGLTRNLPKITFYSLDIHNDQYPRKTFEDSGFEFISLSPSTELASAFIKVLDNKKLHKKPIKVVACDKGAVERTKDLAGSILRSKSKNINKLEVIYIEKHRPRAGEVKKVEITKIESWELQKDEVIKKKRKLPKESNPNNEECVLLYSDDMIDTGGTATKDLEFLLKYYPKASLKVFAATHPVLSKGLLALDRIGADIYLIGNTLNPPGIVERDDVKIVDLAPAIARNI